MQKKLTIEYLTRLVRDFYTKHKRVPRSNEFPSNIRQEAAAQWGSWEAFVSDVLDKKAARHFWTDDELLKWLRDLYDELQRFPAAADVAARSETVLQLLYKRFGNLHEACDEAIGTSVRAEVLLALDHLTPETCPNASTREIEEEVLKAGIKTAKSVVSNTLAYLKREQLVTGGRLSKTYWWSLTQKGRVSVKEIRDAQRRH